MVQAPQYRLRDDANIGWKPVSMGLGCYGQMRRRLGNGWTQGHMGPTLIIVTDPRFDLSAKMILAQRNEKVQTVPAKTANDPFADRVRLGRSRGRFQHP